MSTRRKPRGYKDGGRVPEDIALPPVAPIEAAPVAAELAPATGDIQKHAEAAPPPHDDNPLIKAHRAQIRAEEIQRQAAAAPQGAPATVDDHIASMPISEHKKAFLREHPSLLEPNNAQAVAFHYHAALQRGVPDDTADMNAAILDGIQRERARAVQEARAIVEAPPAVPRRSTVRYSAPVSREAPMPSGRERTPPGINTLSAEERDIARRSIIDRPDMPRMTDAEKEYLYLQNRNRYRQMLADGSYSEQKG
jgi:hypothetical protein